MHLLISLFSLFNYTSLLYLILTLYSSGLRNCCPVSNNMLHRRLHIIKLKINIYILTAVETKIPYIELFLF